MLYLPVNKIVVLDDSLEYYIKGSSFENDDFDFNSKGKYIFKMTEKGLQCISYEKSNNLVDKTNSNSVKKTITTKTITNKTSEARAQIKKQSKAKKCK